MEWSLFVKHWVPFTQGYDLCQIWSKLAKWLWRRFFNLENVFCYFVTISPGKKVWPLIWINLSRSLSPQGALCQVWLKLAQWFWRNHINVFSQFHNYLPLEKGVALHLNNLESFTQGYIVSICFAEIGSVVLENKSSKFCQDIFSISFLSPLGKGYAPSFKQEWIPFTNWCFVPSILKLAQWFWRKFKNFVNVFSLFRNYLQSVP